MQTELITTLPELRAAERDLRTYVAREKSKTCVDLETSSTTGKLEDIQPYLDAQGRRMGNIEIIGVSFDPKVIDRQFVIPTRHFTEDQCRDFLLPWINKTTVVGQNFKYDFRWLWMVYKIYVEKVRCVMLVSQRLNAGRPMKHSLLHLLKDAIRSKDKLEKILGMDFETALQFKDEFQSCDWSQPITQQHLEYMGRDLTFPFIIFDAYQERIYEGVKAGKYSPLIGERIIMECDNIPAYAFMEMHGVPVDRDWHENHVIPFLREKEEEADRELFKYLKITKVKSKGRGKNKTIETTVEPVKVRSPYLKKYLEEQCGVSIPNAQEKTLKRFEHKHIAIKWIMQAKKAKSLLSKFGPNLWELIYADGRFHPNYHQVGTEFRGIKTTRSSSSRPNMQQIPQREKLFGTHKASKLFRRIVKPHRKGWVIGSFDYSTIEPRMTAQYTKDGAMIAELNTPCDCGSVKECKACEGSGWAADLHALTAMAMLELAVKPLRGTPERDHIGKIANLAMGYGIGPRALATFMYDNTGGKVNWTIDEAKEKIAAYFRLYSGVWDAMRDIERKVKQAVFKQNSLAYWRHGKTIYIQHSPTGGHEEFTLTLEEEELAKSNPEVLSRYYKDIDPETGKTKQNLYYKKIGNILREAYNFCIQGACADILKIAVYEVHKTLWREGLTDRVYLWGAIHDELCVECPEELKDYVETLVKGAMIRAAQKYIKLVPIVVNGSWGEDWGECK